jgi:iron complex transport system substrate-binding protein
MLQSAQAKDIALLKKQGLPVLVVNPNTIEEVMSTLLYLGKITGHAQPARAVVKKMRERLKKVIQKANAAPPARLVVIIGNNPLVLAGPGTFIDDIVAVAGGKNLAAEARVAWPQYSLEMLVKQDPEVIIVAKSVVNDEKEIYNDRCWQSIRAVKNNRVFLIDADLISRPGSRLVEAVEAIANFLQH